MGTDTRAAVWAKTNGHCWYCGKLMNPWDDFSVDHIDPRKNGGGDQVENLIPACKSCNSSKHAKTVEQFRAYLAEKAGYRFWGEHWQRQAKTALVKSSEEDEEECEICRCHEMAMAEIRHYAPYWNDPIMLTLTAIASESANYWAHIEVLPEITHQSIGVTLAHVFRLLEDKVIHLTWKDKYKCYALGVNNLQEQWEVEARAQGIIP